MLRAGGMQASPAQALVWNWSFSTDVPSQFGSGTFTTGDVIPSPGVFYDIFDISGTYN